MITPQGRGRLQLDGTIRGTAPAPQLQLRGSGEALDLFGVQAQRLEVDVDMADCSDLVPTVAAMAAVAEGPTRIRGVGFIRTKESDRIGDLSDGLRRMGSNVIEHDDGLEILPGPLSGARLAVHHDHRLAMAWSLVALVVDGVSIDDPNVVSKSWPEWWETRATLLRAAEG